MKLFLLEQPKARLLKGRRMILRTRIRPACVLAILPLISSVAMGATVAQFDGGADTPISLNQFGDPAGASIQPAGGNPGGYLQLTPPSNNQNNWATFDRTDLSAPIINFSFQFQLTPAGAGGADGFSFNLLPTASFGIAGGLGGPVFTAEDPAFAGVLGFGFDTWGNAGLYDANGNGANYSEISLFWNGGLVSRVDDTRNLPVSLNLKDSAWHTVNGTINFLTTNVNMTVDGNPIFTNVAVGGLVPYESRVGLAGRTGNANENAAIDNVNVQFVPEPGAIGAMMAGSLVLFGRRRRT